MNEVPQLITDCIEWFEYNIIEEKKLARLDYRNFQKEEDLIFTGNYYLISSELQLLSIEIKSLQYRVSESNGRPQLNNQHYIVNTLIDSQSLVLKISKTLIPTKKQ